MDNWNILEWLLSGRNLNLVSNTLEQTSSTGMWVICVMYTGTCYRCSNIFTHACITTLSPPKHSNMD